MVNLEAYIVSLQAQYENINNTIWNEQSRQQNLCILHQNCIWQLLFFVFLLWNANRSNYTLRGIYKNEGINRFCTDLLSYNEIDIIVYNSKLDTVILHNSSGDSK